MQTSSPMYDAVKMMIIIIIYVRCDHHHDDDQYHLCTMRSSLWWRSSSFVYDAVIMMMTITIICLRCDDHNDDDHHHLCTMLLSSRFIITVFLTLPLKRSKIKMCPQNLHSHLRIDVWPLHKPFPCIFTLQIVTIYRKTLSFGTILLIFYALLWVFKCLLKWLPWEDA